MRARGMAQEVENLPHNCDALSSNQYHQKLKHKKKIERKESKKE
jgi:hypothetical protein